MNVINDNLDPKNIFNQLHELGYIGYLGEIDEATLDSRLASLKSTLAELQKNGIKDVPTLLESITYDESIEEIRLEIKELIIRKVQRIFQETFYLTVKGRFYMGNGDDAELKAALVYVPTLLEGLGIRVDRAISSTLGDGPLTSEINQGN